MKQKLKLVLMVLSIVLALFALWQVENVARQVRDSEEAKIRLWANAIAQRNGIAEVTQKFFEQATLDEHRKMRLYTDILQSFNDPDQSVDLRFSLSYIHYVVDSAKTPIIITTAKDSLITVPQELAGQKLEGRLMEEFSQNPPFDYKIWGMPMRLYYKESEYFSQLRHVLTGFTRTFLADITNNSVIVPVVIVDSTRTVLLAQGNIDPGSVDTPEKMQARLKEMRSENDPISIILPDGGIAYVYYENSQLLSALRWVPLFYLFIGLVLMVAAYYLFRTTRTMEQNRIWVGLAKETAHQLGTPISSLTGWIEYLRGKQLTDEYAEEVEKDLQRLETITHRFSKIGSVPELKEESVKDAVESSVNYLQSRVPRKVKFVVSFPEGETFIAPLNRYLFEWVIENICKNAIDAMEGAGCITLVASQDARKIYIDISDTGRGMSKAVQRKIFDSGFTTKSRGWGLGLPLARRIINQYHRGRLYLKYSIPGQGSAFRIELKKK
jgi:signal transduction histidine kinase